jgi:predicted enzyme related to lactoylglutathione lyase
MDILGVDNIIFTVGDLNTAVSFYEKLGFPVKFRLDALDICVMSIGFELPGLVLKRADNFVPASKEETARFWVEVPDTQKSLLELKKIGIKPIREPLNLPTGLLVEVADPWGNIVGFMDHLFMPQTGRKGQKKKKGIRRIPKGQKRK